VDSEPDPDRPQLRSQATAESIAEVHRRPVVGGPDQGTITTRPAFIEVFLESNKLYYRPVDAEKAEGVLLYES